MLKASNLSQTVYEHLKSEIHAGRFPTKGVVYETQLAEELGVSRTPVREAIRVLEHEGLVEQLNNRGIRAHPITTRDVQDAFNMRTAIELVIVQLAAERITEAQSSELDAIMTRTKTAMRAELLGEVMKENEQFHRFIAVCTGNRLMEQLIGRVYDYIKTHKLLQRLATQGDVRDIQESIYREHYKIAEAIKAHNVVLAMDQMQKHLKEVSFLYQKSLTQQSSVTTPRRITSNEGLRKEIV